ncbi:MAG: hypothetical protein ACP5ER_01170 [Candidatus Bathyarchaeales archaeon]
MLNINHYQKQPILIERKYILSFGRFSLNTEIKAKDAERVRKPKLPKKRLLKKTRKRKSESSHSFDGAENAKSEPKFKRQTVRFCPKCGLSNIFWASGLPQLWSIWECRNCGYRGPLILENGKLVEKLRKNYFKKISLKR